MTLRPQRGHYYAEVMLNYSAPSIASKYIKAGGYTALQVFFRSKRYVKQVFSSGVMKQSDMCFWANWIRSTLYLSFPFEDYEKNTIFKQEFGLVRFGLVFPKHAAHPRNQMLF